MALKELLIDQVHALSIRELLWPRIDTFLVFFTISVSKLSLDSLSKNFPVLMH